VRPKDRRRKKKRTGRKAKRLELHRRKHGKNRKKKGRL